MAGIDNVLPLLELAGLVYQKCCKYQEDRDDVSYLAVRISILLGIIDNSNFLKDGNTQQRSSNNTNRNTTRYRHHKAIFQQILKAIENANAFMNDFQAAGRIKRVLKAGHWTNRCQKISIELNDLISFLGMSSDLHQLKLLGEIQQAVEESRQKSGKQGSAAAKELKLLRDEISKIAKTGNLHQLNASRLPLKKVHQSVVGTTVVRHQTTATASTKEMTMSNNVSSTIKSSTSNSSTPETKANGEDSLSPRIQRLFENPKYTSMLLDKSHLTYTVGKDDPSGAFGVVHTGSYLGQPVAVKKLLMKNPSPKAIEEVLEEALLMKTYNFMNSFASVYGVCVLDHTPVIVMERMDTDLFQYLHENDNYGYRSSLDWKLRSSLLLTKAVDVLHKLKILHRDLKTPNILVKGKKAEVLRIADFGMARLRKEISTVRSSQTMNGLQLGEHQTVGSYPWMAPEIMQAGKYTTKADTYSLGVIIWEVFTLEEPWKDAVSIRAIESAVLSDKRPDLENKKVPAEIRRILKRTWNADPNLRPGASALVSQIELISSASCRGGKASKNQTSTHQADDNKNTMSSWQNDTSSVQSAKAVTKTKTSTAMKSRPNIAKPRSELEKYLIASKNGDASALYNLGLLYSQGQGGAPQNFRKAAEYYQAAANMGDMKSQSNLALLYYEGAGVAQDLSAAERYFQLAANQGDAVAQRNLGSLYEGGYGVLQDWQLAKKYYSMAAKQGDSTALQQLQSLRQREKVPSRSAGIRETAPSCRKTTPPKNALMKSSFWSS